MQGITSPVVLGLLLYLTITPIGLLMRFLGKRPLALDLDRSASTYWIDRRPPVPAHNSVRS